MDYLALPRVSIGMPVYNGANFIRQAVDSILAQTYADFELIVSDNASTDETQAICQAYAARDPRVRYYRNEKNMGASWNYNRVTALSRGAYIKHAAHDDVLAPTYLERCVEVMDREPSVVLCYPRSIHIDEHGNRVELPKVSLHLMSDRPHERFKVFQHNCSEVTGADPVFGLYRASALRKTPVVANYIGSDIILMAELSLLGKFYEVPEELFYLRCHPNTSVRANPGRDDRAAWFDPANRGRLRNQLVHFEWFRRTMAAIGRVEMSPYERFLCYRQMPRWLWRRRDGLTSDLVLAAGCLLKTRRGAASTRGPEASRMNTQVG